MCIYFRYLNYTVYIVNYSFNYDRYIYKYGMDRICICIIPFHNNITTTWIDRLFIFFQLFFHAF